MVVAQKIFRLDSGEAQHFRNLVERQSLFAVPFESDSFQDAAGHIAAGNRKPLGHIVRDVKGDLHSQSLV
jgi:hypothetical protein